MVRPYLDRYIKIQVISLLFVHYAAHATISVVTVAGVKATGQYFSPVTTLSSGFSGDPIDGSVFRYGVHPKPVLIPR